MRSTALIGASIIALTASAPALAQAQTGTPSAVVDPNSADIIVTATKREQTLQDVPISVSVTGQQTIEKAQIRDLIDLQSVVPSLKVQQFNASGQTNFVIRGFGNGNGNDGIESSVGVFIDGVYRSRSGSALDDLPEIERVEVLRGPQSTLFGKNVSAGAISIVTKKPQFDFGMKAEISLGTYGLINPRLTVTGPISQTIAVRLSGSVNERDGYFNNIVTGSKVNDRNRWSLRGDVLWQPSADLSVRVIGDYNLIREKCCGVVQIHNGPATQIIGAPTAAGGLGAIVLPDTEPFAQQIAFSTDPVNRLRGYGVSAQLDYNTGIGKITSITAYRNQASSYAQDVDFTGSDLADRVSSNQINTFTQEFRLASDSKGPLNYLVGGFYENEKLTTGTTINFGKNIRRYADILSGNVAAGPLAGASNIFALEFLQSLVNPTIVPGRTYFQAGPAVSDSYHLSQTSYSIFGQVDFKPFEHLTLTGGVAYLNDRKAVIADVHLPDKFSALDLSAVPELPFVGLPGNAFAGLNALQFFYTNTGIASGTTKGPVNYPNAKESGIFSGDKVTYAARAAYDLGIVNAYVSYSTGWKASAVNLSYDSRPPGLVVSRGAAPESVTVYEAGLKAKVRNGFLNIAVFKQAIKNFQSNLYNGTGYDLINAEKESVRGVEVDAAYRPLPWLSLTGAATYLDPKYDSFTRASCYSYEVCITDPATGLKVRDRSGTRPAGIPEWSVSSSATISHDLTESLSAYLRGEFDYTSDVQLTETTPTQYGTSGSSNVNASVGFIDAVAKLEVMAWVRNLTNDHALIATFPTVAQSGSYSGYPVQPRMYGVTLRKTF